MSSPITAEQRAKVADLCHEIMAIVGQENDAYSATVYDTCEEWHDHYRWIDGSDVFDQVRSRTSDQSVFLAINYRPGMKVALVDALGEALRELAAEGVIDDAGDNGWAYQ